MANEFIIKNGFHSKGDSETSGSLKVSGSRFDVDVYLGERKYTYPTISDGQFREISTPSGPEFYSENEYRHQSSSFIAGSIELRSCALSSGIITNYSYCSITEGAGLLMHRISGSSPGADSGFVTNDSGLFVVDSLPSPNGLKYAADYSATYVSRSLVDQEYVVDYVAASGSGDNIANANLTFDGAHYADLNSNEWSIKNGSDSYFNIKSTGEFVLGKDTVDNSTDTTYKHKNTVIGSQSTIAASSIQQATSIGYNNTVNTTNGLALGHSNTVSLGTSIGTSNANTSYNGIALGSSNTISNSGVVCVGAYNNTNKAITQMLGWKLNPLHDYVTMLGAGLSTSSKLQSTASSQFIVGWNSTTPTILIGATSDSYIKSTGNLSLETNTTVKGSDNAAATSGFKVIDVNNNSLLDVKNSGKIIISKAQTGVSLESYSNLSVWAGVSNSSVESIRVSAGTNYSGVHFIDNNSVVGSSTSGNIFLKGNFGSSSTESLVNLNDNIEFKTKSSKAVKFFTNNIQFINDTDSVTYGRIISDVFVWGGAAGSFFSPIGTEKFSIQVDTLIKGSDTSASTTGFKVTDSTNASLLDIKNDGKTEITGKLDLSTTTDGFLMPRLTTAQMNAISSPDTYLLVFNTDLDCVMRYNGTAWTTFDSPKYIVRSGGTNTPYSDFKTAVDDAPAGAVLEVHTSEVIDVGMPSTYWNWTKDLTIQTNGHDVIMTNLSRIQIAVASNLNTLNIIGGGTFSSSHNQVFTIYRNLTINSDGATNIVSTATNGILFQPISNVAGTTFTVNNVKSVGVYFRFTGNNNLQHYTTLNNCHVDLTNSTTNASIINYTRVTANNCVFKQTGGSITYPQNSAFATVTDDEAFIFNNCTTVGNYGRCMLRLNNCSITTTTTTNAGIYNVTLEANNTSFKNINTGSPSNIQGYTIASTALVILKNCTIDSDWGGVYLSTESSIIDNCTIKSGNSWGVFRYNSGANVSNFLTIKNSTIEVGTYSAIGTIYGSLGKQFDISNTTIITGGTSNHCCLSMSTGTHARFDNLKLKNLATPANILSRATLLTENPQVNTLDNLGNIVLA